MTLYDKLGVSQTATADEVQKAYRKKARKAHPDVGGDPKEFNALSVARDTLTDPAARALYDATGQTPHDAPELPAAVRMICDIAAECSAKPAGTRQNLLASIREVIRLNIIACKGAAQKYAAHIDNIQKHWVEDEIRVQVIADFELRRAKMDGQRAVGEAALELLKSSKYDFVEGPASFRGFGGW